jgi:hypothetical protein
MTERRPLRSISKEIQRRTVVSKARTRPVAACTSIAYPRGTRRNGHLSPRSDQIVNGDASMPPRLPGALRLFEEVRNKIVHGVTTSDDDALSALDSGLAILRALNALPPP